MLYQMIDESFIQLKIKARDWEEAIRKSALPLLKKEKITEQYIDKIIEITRTTGPYIVITKHTALPHAPSEFGAKELAMSITTLENPISSGHTTNDPVKYLFCLSAPDSNSHLKALSNLVQLLDDENFIQTLDYSNDAIDILDYIKFKEIEGRS